MLTLKGVYNDTNAPYEPQLQQHNHQAPARSLSQLKPSPNLAFSNNSNGGKTHKATKPVQKLLKNLSVFKTLFHVVQRDLVVNIFLLDIPKLSQYDQPDAPSSLMRSTDGDRPISRSTNENISQKNNQSKNSQERQNRLKLIQRIKR